MSATTSDEVSTQDIELSFIDSPEETSVVYPKPKFPLRFVIAFMLFCSNLINYADRTNMSIAIIPMAQQFNWSNLTQASVLSAFYYGYVCTQILGGVLVKKFGGKIILYIGAMLWSVFTIITPYAAILGAKYWFGILFLARVGLGLFEGFNNPSVHQMVGEWIPKGERTRVLAVIFCGGEVGALIALFLGPLITISLGWDWSFYIFGGAGIIWALLFALITTSTPEGHAYISEYEKQYITTEKAKERGNVVQSTLNWTLVKSMLTSKCVWAMAITHMSTNWLWFNMVSFLPKLFISLGASFEMVGIFSMMPYLIVVIVSNCVAHVSDFMINRLDVSVENTRKIMQSIALVASSILFFSLRFASSLVVATVLICCAMGCASFHRSGVIMSSVDLSPRNAGILMGFSNSLGTIPGIVGNMITGLLLDVAPPENTIYRVSPFDNVFNVVIVISLFGALVYLRWIKGTVQFQ
jgi:ACS family sodium-dependent inorganic phosphate cotransporter